MSYISKKELLLMKENLIKDIDNKVLSNKSRITNTAQQMLIENLLNQMELKDKIFEMRKITGITLRKGSTVLVEEFIQNHTGMHRDECNMDEIFKRVSKTYKVLNRNKTPLRDVNNFHPENPAYQAEVNNFNIGYYKSIIHEIVKNGWWLIDEDIVLKSFKTIHNEIKFS